MAPAELRATYRLQLTSRFGFAAARTLVPYLRDLGISHLYLSPSFQARPGSSHGYDVIDPRWLSDDLGGRAEFEQLAGEARHAGLGLVLDVVPNHMAADNANRYWADPQRRQQFFDLDQVTGRHRRFFDIDDLAGVRQEDPAVFEETHELVLGLVRDGLVDGLRVDHPDGLADPPGYLARLRSAGVERVWVEKILDPDERLRDWPVSGTVGYEFLNDVCALFVDPAGEGRLTRLWEQISGDQRRFGEVAFQAKLEQAESTFSPEVERLAREDPDAPADRLPEALAGLPVYRTYVDPGTRRVDDEDRRALAGVDAAIRQRLLLEHPSPPGFVLRFQQTTPAIMAKGVEDTAFYRYGRLLALNDVGGDPSRFGIGVDRFHSGCRERAERFPEGLLTTMTHDAKRSGDVRARIGTLASIPEEWAAQVERWFAVTAPLRSGQAPDDVESYFIFQTLVGAWPIESERLEAYMIKALREAKRHTNWVEPNHDYEEGVARFCRELYSIGVAREEFGAFIDRVAKLGDRAALGALVLKLTAPGVPDIYQGDELPYRALVDPDNRRPVDWGWRQAMLQRVMGGSPPVGETRKLFLTLRLLSLRARKPDIFSLGSYEPLEAGPGACAFLRAGRLMVVVELPRAGAAAASLSPPAGRWRDVLRYEERSFSGPQVVDRLTDAHGIGVFERIAA
ncbi:MAG TPA: malto-oligosyltrehalose synthase [Solirubrobacteraceae bacterium]|nr:malto-oligosyltrehalose synthase [Solirubrobacteraceae bacterium]